MKHQLWMRCSTKNSDTTEIKSSIDVAEQILPQIINFVKNAKLNLNVPTLSQDGRVNSSLQEKIVTDFIQNSADIKLLLNNYQLQLLIPEEREWFDFCIFDNKYEIFIPVNIKISALKTADSVSSKKGLYFACTGVLPYNNSYGFDDLEDSFKTNKWTEFYKKLKRDVDKHTERDYYFLIVNKNNSEDVFLTSLKTLKIISPNGSNLPFLCNWDLNRERVFRSHKESRKFLLQKFYDSLKLSSESILLGLKILRKLGK